MKYWWLLQLTFVFDGEQITQSIPMEGINACSRALTAAESFHSELDRTLSGVMMGCKETDIVSGWTIRPKARPE